MGGVMGAVSTKLAFAAGTLLLSARIGMHPVTARLDPSLSVSRVSRQMEVNLHLVGIDKNKGDIVGLDHYEVRLSHFDTIHDNIDEIVLGRDFLRKITLLLDFPSKRLRVMEAAEFRRSIAGLTPITTAVTSDGCLSIDAIGPDGATVHTAIVGTSVADEAGVQKIMIHTGTVDLDASKFAPGGPCRSNDVVLDWQALAHKRVILDLEHDQLWIS